MKTILASLIAVSALATRADAGTKTPNPKPNYGESYGLHARRASRPRSVDPVASRTLSDHRADRVIKERGDDLENCWLRLPARQRVATGAILHLAIEPDGSVSAARVTTTLSPHASTRGVLDQLELEGDLPASVVKCMTSAALRWSFPAADGRTTIEHGITLTTTR